MSSPFHVDEDTILHLDHNGDLHVKTTQDVEAVIERNKERQKEAQRSDWGRHVAEIPNVIITKWLNEEWARGNIHLRPFTPEFDLVAERKMKDPDYAYLRSDSKHVQGFLGWMKSAPILGSSS